jgi:hypothetical protein
MQRLFVKVSLGAFLLTGASANAQLLDLSWRTIDCGGGQSAGSGFTLDYTIGQHDAGVLSGGGYEITGGFWGGAEATSCYANCDGSASVPVLNINDFVCFQQKFASGDSFANCDGSTTSPVLNVNDFVCFQQRFASGCQ